MYLFRKVIFVYSEYSCFFIHIVYSSRTMSQTYKPKNKKRKTTHGFLARKATPGGRAVLKSRRRKGRAKLAV